jgi:hypothetical protein
MLQDLEIRILYFEFWIYLKLIRYQFWCTRCVFRLIKSLLWCSGRKAIRKKCENCENFKKPKNIDWAFWDFAFNYREFSAKFRIVTCNKSSLLQKYNLPLGQALSDMFHANLLDRSRHTDFDRGFLCLHDCQIEFTDVVTGQQGMFISYRHQITRSPC